ncbi:glycosyl transferase family 90-domain-containing protein [Mrakia frigida]|uniref:glycosyl transferase family 90-domain-containing protein n=1 Tax=Mrakia frigida TaxID=29902 RepID=UPI003FCC00DD
MVAFINGYTSLPSSSSSIPPNRGPFLRRILPLAILVFLALSLLSSLSSLPPISSLIYSSPPPAPSEPPAPPSSPYSLESQGTPYPPSSNEATKGGGGATKQGGGARIPHGKHPIVNGLLEVKMDISAQRHPIHQLIESSKVEWEDKKARQSRDFVQAVEEYKRRNRGRNPPKGFDHWWTYIQEHNVPLPDEYDRIMKDLGPFRGFSPETLRARIAHLQTLDSTFSLSVLSGVLTEDHDNFDKEKYYGSQARAQGQYDFIKDVAQWIPDFVAVLSVHDVPTQFVSWNHLEELKALDEEGEYFDPNDEADRPFTGWAAACPPGSNLYNQTLAEAISRLPPPDHPPSSFPPSTLDSHPSTNSSFPPPPEAPPPLTLIPPHYHAPLPDPASLLSPPFPHAGKPKSFIANLTSLMDICAHPDIIPLHGTTAGREPEPSAVLMPIFSLSKTNLHSDILVIPIEQWSEPEGALHWNEKEEGRLLWRGRNTGMQYTSLTPWRSSHRARLARLASYHLENIVEVIPPPRTIALALSALAANSNNDGGDGGRSDEAEEEREGADRRRSRVRREEQEREKRKTFGSKVDLSMEDVLLGVQQGQLNERLLDVGLAYDPIQCDQEDGTCDDVTRELTFRPVTTFDHENHYKYILDIDGNAWSARFKRLLNSNALVLKSTIYPEWWNDRIQPWVHYVPVKVDYDDIYDIMSFFQGDRDLHPGENDIARAIAEAGREWSLTHWRREDMTAYMFRLYLEWARLLADDPSAAEYLIEDHPDHP